MWSFRGNACDIPTDCPTRERAGWTGDWQVFVPVAAFLYDFVIGDDWLIAAGVAVALAVPYGISRTSAPTWWVSRGETALPVGLSSLIWISGMVSLAPFVFSKVRPSTVSGTRRAVQPTSPCARTRS